MTSSTSVTLRVSNIVVPRMNYLATEIQLCAVVWCVLSDVVSGDNLAQLATRIKDSISHEQKRTIWFASGNLWYLSSMSVPWLPFCYGDVTLGCVIYRVTCIDCSSLPYYVPMTVHIVASLQLSADHNGVLCLPYQVYTILHSFIARVKCVSIVACTMSETIICCMWDVGRAVLVLWYIYTI